MEKREGARNNSTRLVSMTHFSTPPPPNLKLDPDPPPSYKGGSSKQFVPPFSFLPFFLRLAHHLPFSSPSLADRPTRLLGLPLYQTHLQHTWNSHHLPLPPGPPRVEIDIAALPSLLFPNLLARLGRVEICYDLFSIA